MGYPDRTNGAANLGASLIFRGLFIVLGLFALAWSLWVFPIFWRTASLDPAVSRILAGDAFSPASLEILASIGAGIPAQASCVPTAYRDVAILDIRRAETALRNGERAEIDNDLADARAAVRRSLSCNPADTFLWFALTWLENGQSGSGAVNVDFLRMSYRTGPNEGWVSARRNRYAMALYDALPDDLQDDAMHEYLRLLDSDLVTEAADVFLGPGWPVRDLLLRQVERTSLPRREFFAKLVRGRGYEGEIPGVTERGRPERR